MLSGVYVSSGSSGSCPVGSSAFVVLRDFDRPWLVLIQTTAAPKRFDPLSISKLNTLVQLSLIGFVLAQGSGSRPSP